MSVDAVVYYRVSNATVSVANVENAHHSTRLLAQTTLRNILGTKNLHEILSDRESISGSMQVRQRGIHVWGYAKWGQACNWFFERHFHPLKLATSYRFFVSTQVRESKWAVKIGTCRKTKELLRYPT